MTAGGQSLFSLRAAGPQPPSVVARMAEAGRGLTFPTGLRRYLIEDRGCRRAPPFGMAPVLRRRLRALEPGRNAPAGSRDAVFDHLKNPRVRFLHVRPALRGPFLVRVDQ